MPRPLADRTSLIAIASASAIAGAQQHRGPRAPGATVASGDVAPYTTPRTGVVTDSGVTGRAMIVTPAGSERSIVRIHAEGLAPRHAYGVHVHFGTCLQYQATSSTRTPARHQRQRDLAGPAREGRPRARPGQTSRDSTRPLSIVIHAMSNPDLAPGQPGHPGARIACADPGTTGT